MTSCKLIHLSCEQIASVPEKRKMIHFDLSTHIYRPLTQVFTFVAAPENDFQWQYGTLTSTQISRGAVGIGTIFRTMGHLLGRRIETEYVITVFELNKRYGFKAVSGPVDSDTLYTFEMAQGGTRINLFTRVDSAELFKPNETMIGKKFKKQHKENLAMLKSVMEDHRIVRV